MSFPPGKCLPAASVAVLAASLALRPGPAAAHAFGQRYDLPLPLGFYLAAAGAAVALSFLGSFLFLRETRQRPLALDVALPRRLGLILAVSFRTLGLLTLALVLLAAFLGPALPTDNFATVMVWVLWWVGFFLLSALLVDCWAALDPFRGLALVLCRLLGRNAEDPPAVLPPWAGWIAVAGLLAISWVELVSDWSEDPRALGILILVYAAGSLLGGLVFGRAWFSRADPLGQLFSLLGRMAPLSPEPPDRLVLALPAARLGEPVPLRASAAVFVVALIAIVLFDGLSETPLWASILDFVGASKTLRPGLLLLREAGFDLLKLLQTLGLLATLALSLLAYWLLSLAMALAVGWRLGAGTFALAFAGSLLPIAVAYHLAHYISYLLLAGQLVVPTLADPFALGWSLLEGRRAGIDIGVITAKQVWWIAVTALVVGHGLSVVVAHRQAVALLGDRALAVRSQLPMMAFMTGLTMLSLWILAQPIVQ